MAGARTTPFNSQTFLTKSGKGRATLTAHNKQIIFSQGDMANAVFYI